MAGASGAAGAGRGAAGAAASGGASATSGAGGATGGSSSTSSGGPREGVKPGVPPTRIARGGPDQPPCGGEELCSYSDCDAQSCLCYCDCERDADCGGGRCLPIGEPRPPCCGAGPQCFQDSDCGANDVCVQLGGGCASCAPACTSDADCGEAHVCEPNGQCRIATCQDDGYECPRLSECATGSDLPTDSHGCVHDTCNTDAECPDAHCVNGRCYQLPGQCYAQGCA